MSREKLLESLVFLLPATSDIGGINSCVCMTSATDQLILKAQNGDCAIEKIIEVKGLKPRKDQSNVLVNIEDLIKVLSSVNDEEITLKINKDDIEIRSSIGIDKLPRFQGEFFCVMLDPFEDQNAGITLDPVDLENILSLAVFTSKDKNKPVLRGICLESIFGSIMGISGIGQYMSKVEFGKTHDFGSICIPHHAIPILNNFLRSSSIYVSLKWNDHLLFIESKEDRAVCRLYSDKYPSVIASLFNEAPIGDFNVNQKTFLELLKVFPTEKEDFFTKFKFTSKKLEILKANERANLYRNTEIKLNGSDYEIELPVSQLLGILKFLGEGEIEIKYFSALRIQLTNGSRSALLCGRNPDFKKK